MSIPLDPSLHDAAAFEALYRRTVARVHSLARRIVGARDADEATQEVYLRAWQKRASFRGESDAATWLHRLAVHAIVNHGRRRGDAAPARASELDVEELPARSAHAAHDRELEDAIARLPDGARETFVLREIEGLSHAEIAERLGVTTGTTKSQLHRARELLRARLEHKGTSHA